MSKRITTDNVRLKRAYASSAADDGAQHRVAEMVRPRSRSLAVISQSLRIGGPQASWTAQTGYVTRQGMARSRSCSRLTTKVITTSLC